MLYGLKYIPDTGPVIDFGIQNLRSGGPVIGEQSGIIDNHVNFAESQGASQVGTTIQGKSIKGKPIQLSGTIKGEAQPWRKALVDATAGTTGGNLVYNDRIEMRVEVQDSAWVSSHAQNARYQLAFYASYPFWRSIQQIKTDVAGLQPRFSFPINYANTFYEADRTKHIFGERISTYFVNVINQGNVPAQIRVVFLANTQLSNPYITKVSTLEYIKIKKDMVAGEKIIVDNMGAEPSITNYVAGVEANAFHYLDRRTTFFDIDVGDNLIRYDADVNREALDASIIHADTWSGAYIERVGNG